MEADEISQQDPYHILNGDQKAGRKSDEDTELSTCLFQHFKAEAKAYAHEKKVLAKVFDGRCFKGKTYDTASF